MLNAFSFFHLQQIPSRAEPTPQNDKPTTIQSVHYAQALSQVPTKIMNPLKHPLSLRFLNYQSNNKPSAYPILQPDVENDPAAKSFSLAN